MPFDFRMKHAGEPPARMMAQAQMRFREYGVPARWAARFVPFMRDEEDLDDYFMATILSAASMGERAGMSEERVLELMDQAIANFQKAAETVPEEEQGAEEDEDEEIMALHPRLYDRRKRRRPNLTVEMVAIQNGKGNKRCTRNHAPREDQFGTTMVNGAHPDIRMLTDYLTGRRDPRQPAPWLSEIAMFSARRSGQRPFNIAEGVRMAMHSTSDFPRILEGFIGNTVARRMEQTVPGLLRASHLMHASTYHQGSLLGLSASGIPQEIAETGEIKHVTIYETGEVKPVPRDFGSMFRISQRAIVNDDLGLLEQITEKMVAGANERLRRVLLEPLLANGGAGHVMSDGKPVFHADHGNLAGTASTLTLDSLSEARIALRSQRGPQGEHYGCDPWALVVPPQLETRAQQIAAAAVSEVNPFSGKLEVIVEAGLTNPAAWYLIADPSKHDGLAHAFLEGRNAPNLESREGWNTLGLDFRLVWALDARFVSWASWYRNPGA